MNTMMVMNMWTMGSCCKNSFVPSIKRNAQLVINHRILHNYYRFIVSVGFFKEEHVPKYFFYL